MKKTLVIGASTNPSRYSYLAINNLRHHGHEVCALGLKQGEVAGVNIDTEKLDYEDINTVTLYIGPQNQAEYEDYVISLNPKRVIFNPGTENLEFERRLQQEDIEVEEACTLVLLSTGQY